MGAADENEPLEIIINNSDKSQEGDADQDYFEDATASDEGQRSFMTDSDQSSRDSEENQGQEATQQDQNPNAEEKKVAEAETENLEIIDLATTETQTDETSRKN